MSKTLKLRATNNKSKVFSVLAGNRKVTKGAVVKRSAKFYEVQLMYDPDERLNGVRFRGEKILELHRGYTFYVVRKGRAQYEAFKRELNFIANEPVSTLPGQVSTAITDSTGVLVPEVETEDGVRETLDVRLEDSQYKFMSSDVEPDRPERIPRRDLKHLLASANKAADEGRISKSYHSMTKQKKGTAPRTKGTKSWVS